MRRREGGGVVVEPFLPLSWDEAYLEEEAEADPLVVLDVSPLLRVYGLVNARVCHINAYPLPEGTGNGVGGVDPAVGVEHILWYVLGVDTIDGVAHILSCGHNEGESQQAHHRESVVQPEDGGVNVDVANLDKVLEPSKDVQHLDNLLLAGLF